MTEEKLTFAQLFLRRYDRAIGNGVCSFSQTGIGAMNFTNMCVNKDFVIADDEIILKVCRVMKLPQEDIDLLLQLAAEGRNDE